MPEEKITPEEEIDETTEEELSPPELIELDEDKGERITAGDH